MNIAILYTIATSCLQCKEAEKFDDIVMTKGNTHDRILTMMSEAEMKSADGTMSEEKVDFVMRYMEELLEICYYCKRKKALLAEKIEIEYILSHVEEKKEERQAERALERNKRKQIINAGKEKKSNLIIVDFRNK